MPANASSTGPMSELLDDSPIYSGLVREQRLADTFVSLTDTLVRDFDAADMLTVLTERCVELLGFAGAGIILTTRDGDGRDEPPSLAVAAASSEHSRLLLEFAVATDTGPHVECLRTAHPAAVHDLTADRRWPQFSAGAGAAGFRATHAVPMRLRDEVIGGLTLLHTEPRTLNDADARLGQALADAATIGLLHERAVRLAETLTEQLQGVLNSRVIIEQAKGILAAHGNFTVDEAFLLLRSHARAHGTRLTDIARGVADGSVDAVTITGVDR